jgi:uncharacterized protein (DUF924 family)
MHETFQFMALALGNGAIAAVNANRAPADARKVVVFWRDAGPGLWFAKDAEFDGQIRARFLALYERAARGELEDWLTTAEGAFALLILLDQFPRNAFRGTPLMYATDALACEMARRAIAAEHDLDWPVEERKFFYMPFAHSEQLADQERAVKLCKRLSARDVISAQHHYDIVARFGRFPHRNAILGRTTTADEQAYLDGGGYTG